MALRHIALIVILIIQLYGTSLASDLPKLPNNKLSEGADRDLPNATPIHCGKSSHRAATVKSTNTPDHTMHNFKTHAFTAGPVGHPQSPKPGTEAKFKFAEVKGGATIYALEVDETGEHAYWLPQGGSIDIPHKPDAKQPHYVFTPDFSGCSWTVTPLTNGMLRLRHVEGGREPQFNKLSEAEKGGPITYALEYKEYGYKKETSHLLGNVPGFAYMHFSGGHWTMHVQRQTCAPHPGGYTFNKDNHLTGMMLLETKSSYPTISGTKSLTIP